MAKHEVVMTAPDMELGRADVEFKVKFEQSVIGTLKLSKGGVTWVSRDKTYGKEIKWRDLAELLERGNE